MASVNVELPEEIFSMAKMKKEKASQEVRRLIALELFRENAISLEKAAKIAGLSIAEFMELLGKRGIPLHYTKEDLEADRKTAERLAS